MNLHELQEIANNAEKMLKDNPEWISRYAGYAVKVKENMNKIIKARKQFREPKSLYVYSCISEAKKANENHVTFDLRYRGQSVAGIEYRNDNVKLLPKDNTLNFFGKKFYTSFDWKSKEAEEFRSYFANTPPRDDSAGKPNEEHRCESALLTELSKKIGRKKVLKNIQPIRLVKSRFQMPTPFSASGGLKDESNPGSGGGIDLLCRTKHGNKSILNVFELKDEYESPMNVWRQAIIYSVFICKLLNNKEANNSIWWKEIFGFKTLPNPNLPVSINVVIALPHNESGKNYEQYAKNKIKLNDGCEINLHYLWFTLLKLDGKEDRITRIDTSLFDKT